MLALPLLGSALFGCSVLFELDREQCTSNADCSTFGADYACEENLCVFAGETGGAGGEAPVAFPENLACAEDFVPPETGDMIYHNYRFEIATAAPGTPPPNLVAVLCTQIDTLCLNPIGDPMIPDAEGRIEFEVPKNFTGRLEVTADDIVPSLVFFQAPVKVPESEKLIRVISKLAIEAIAASQDVPLDLDNTGVIVAFAEDCNEQRIVGAHFATDVVDPTGEMRAYHFVSDLPNPTATVTDSLGAGGWVNVPIGPFTARVEWCETSPASCPPEARRRTIGQSTFLIRKGFMSYVPMGPSVLGP